MKFSRYPISRLINANCLRIVALIFLVLRFFAFASARYFFLAILRYMRGLENPYVLQKRMIIVSSFSLASFSREKSCGYRILDGAQVASSIRVPLFSGNCSFFVSCPLPSPLKVDCYDHHPFCHWIPFLFNCIQHIFICFHDNVHFQTFAEQN